MDQRGRAGHPLLDDSIWRFNRRGLGRPKGQFVDLLHGSGDLVLDFFAGSGTAGEAAAKNGREFCMVDESAEAIAVMEERLQMKAERHDGPGVEEG